MAEVAERVAPVDRQTFSWWTLTAMVVGSMVGAAIFSLPARFGIAPSSGQSSAADAAATA
jgi:arginine:ornithine antiporter/lysine permease